jgi:hypothetical protein
MLIGPSNNKKMQERPDNEPHFNKNNKTDRKILAAVLLSSIVLIILIISIIIMYVSGIWH